MWAGRVLNRKTFRRDNWLVLISTVWWWVHYFMLGQLWDGPWYCRTQNLVWAWPGHFLIQMGKNGPNKTRSTIRYEVWAFVTQNWKVPKYTRKMDCKCASVIYLFFSFLLITLERIVSLIQGTLVQESCSMMEVFIIFRINLIHVQKLYPIYCLQNPAEINL